MKLADLEKRLHYGERWGFIKETGSPAYLGWVLISKRRHTPISAFDPATHPAQYALWLKHKEEKLRLPYHVSIRELRRDVHESGEYENTGDYRLIENFYVSSLEEVQTILDKYNLNLEEARLSAELDAP